VVISAAALLSGCGDSIGPAAARVGNTTISRATLDDELKIITDNPTWVKSVSQSFSTDITPTDGGVATRLSSAWLTTLVNQVIVDEVFEQRHLTVTDKNRSAARTAAIGIFGDQATFNELPRAYRTKVIDRQAKYQAVLDTLPPPKPPTDADLQPLLESTRASLCPGGVLVAHIQVASKADADAILAELAQGADFGTLAKERSLDTESRSGEGIVACTDSQNFSSFPQEFRNAVAQLPVGGVSPAVQVGANWHVIRTANWNLESARPILVRIFEGNRSDPMTLFINDRLVKKKVWVDPRYGTVQRGKASVVITPPLPIELRTDPAEPTTTTTAFGATGQ
jgi:PPIC-type PPIASE domain